MFRPVSEMTTSEMELELDTLEKLSLVSDLDNVVDEKLSFDGLKISKMSLSGAGCLFEHKEGFMPEIMKSMFDLRTIYKKEMIEAEREMEAAKSDDDTKVASLKAKQNAIKILMNGLYGAMCNIYFRYFSYDLAMSITLSGQLTAKWIDKHFNIYMNKLCGTTGIDYVIAQDTDSMYINCGPLVRKAFSDKIPDNARVTMFLDEWAAQKAQIVIRRAYDDLAKVMNAYHPCLDMKRESIANRAIWTRKKRYIMSVLDQERVRYSEPKLKYKGLEVVRSNIPEVARNALKEAIDIIMTKSEDELIKFVSDFREKYRKMDFYEIAFPRGINGVQKYYDPIARFKKKCPAHVKGAIVYNEFLKEHGLTERYGAVQDGEKVKFCYLKLPNLLHCEIITAPGKIPEEMEIRNMIDYDEQFQTSFLKPLQGILNVIGWKHEKQNVLEW